MGLVCSIYNRSMTANVSLVTALHIAYRDSVNSDRVASVGAYMEYKC